MEIGSTVRIIRGDNAGKIGIYQGKHTNSNWHIVQAGAERIFINIDDLAEIPTSQPNPAEVIPVEVKPAEEAVLEPVEEAEMPIVSIQDYGTEEDDNDDSDD